MRSTTVLPDPPIVWMASSLVRISESGATPGPQTIEVHAAKGESVSLQLCVQAPASTRLTGVTVTATDFWDEDRNDTIASSNIVFYREAYIPSTTPLIADALIPFRHPENPDIPVDQGAPFDIEPTLTQPVWVDVNVPRTANAGRYIAAFTVTSRQGATTVTATLRVWNFALPVQPALKSAFLMQRQPTRFLAKELLRHRLMPKDVRTDADIVAAAWPELIELGLNIASIPASGHADTDHGTMVPPPASDELRKMAAPYGRELPLYCYSADEIGGVPALFPIVKAWGENLHAAGISQLVTVSPTPELYCDKRNCVGESRRSAVDIWVVLPSQYDPEMCRHVQMKGEEVWSYNSVNHEIYRPKWFFESQPIEFRIQPGFFSQALGFSGLLYWGVDYWREQPWRDALGYLAPGDGLMVYPGDVVGLPGYVVPSIRLKWLRDGVNDFDYVEMLKRIGRGDYAMSVARRIDENWWQWTPGDFEEERRKLGEALNDPSTIPEITPPAP